MGFSHVNLLGVIQWSVGSTTWINIPFWLSIYESLPDTEGEKEAIEALKEMIMNVQVYV